MKQLTVFLYIILSPLSLNAQGKVLESLEMKSELLKTNIKYSIYLPENYTASQQDYPVLYLLSGFEGNEMSWLIDGKLEHVMHSLSDEGIIKPMIVVMPDGDDRLYMNKDDGSYPYEDMFFSEFIPFIEDSYRIKKLKSHRAISGWSMGGSGALRWSILFPDVFGICAALSPGISTIDEILVEGPETFDSYFGQVSPSIIGKTGKDRITSTMLDYDVLHILDRINPKTLNHTDFYIASGDDDFFTVGISELHISLMKKGVPHEFRMSDGGHDWNYWRKALPDGLKFISNSFPSD